MKDFRKLRETNQAGAGNIAALPPDTPAVKKKKKKEDCMVRREVFAGMDVFEVSQDTFLRCKDAKGRYDRYIQHVGEDAVGQAIREFGLKHHAKAIILKDNKYGNMTFLRYGKNSAVRRNS
tara:strand:+ start:359 stop:721 length:363 start_codon:yes stop_codon:yes gene_type:complete